MSDGEITRLQVTITPNLRELDAGLGAAVNRARASANAIAGDLNTAFETADREASKRVGAITDKMRNMGIGLSVAVTAPLAMAGKAAVDNAVKMDSLRRSMDAVAPSAAAAKQELEDLKKVAALPGLGYKEAIQLAVGLQATGIEAKEAQRYMIAFGNAIATVGGGKEQIAAVGVQLQQMAGKAHPMMQDIRIIQEYVPQMLQAMKALYGTTDTEAISKMGIGTKQFLRDIVGELEKLPKITGGIQNDLENLTDQWFRFSAGVGDKAIPALSELVRAGAEIMDTFNGLPAPMQNIAIGIGVAVAAAGPLLVVSAALIRSKVTLTETIAALSIKRAQEAAWIAQITGLETAEVTSTGALAGAKAKLAGSIGMVGGAAGATLRVLGPLAFGLAALAHVSDRISQANKSASANGQQNSLDQIQSFQRGLSGKYSGDVLKSKTGADSLIADIAKLEQSHNRVAEEMTKVQAQDRRRREGWQKAKDYTFGTIEVGNQIAKLVGLDFDAEWEGRIKELQDREQQAADKLNAAKDKLREAGWTRAGGRTTQAAAELNADQKKALAANEEANRLAQQDVFVLSQSTESAKKRAQAMVDLTNEKKKLNDAAAKVKAETGVTLNIAPQIEAAERAYSEKIKEIVATEARVAEDQKIAAQVASINLRALQATDAYESERLQVQAGLVQTLHELKQAKASELDVRVATAEAQKQITEINRRQAAELDAANLAEATAGAMAAALESDDKQAQSQIQAANGFYQTLSQLRSVAERGLPWAKQAYEALARYNATIRDSRKQAAEEAAKAEQEKYNTAFAAWGEGMEAMAAGRESASALKGDEYTGKIEALGIRHKAALAKLDKDQSAATTKEQTWAIEKRRIAEELGYQKQLLELENQRAQVVLDRVNAMRDEQRALEDQTRERNRAAMEERRNSVGMVSIEQKIEQNALAGFRQRYEPVMPLRPGPPGNSEIDGNLIRQALDMIAQEARNQTATLKQVVQVMRPSYGEAR